MTDPNSPEVQAIFTQLHALGVTPESAAGVARLSPQWRFRVGDTALRRALEIAGAEVARLKDADEQTAAAHKHGAEHGWPAQEKT